MPVPFCIHPILQIMSVLRNDGTSSIVISLLWLVRCTSWRMAQVICAELFSHTCIVSKSCIHSWGSIRLACLISFLYPYSPGKVSFILSLNRMHSTAGLIFSVILIGKRMYQRMTSSSPFISLQQVLRYDYWLTCSRSVADQ